MIPSCRSFIVNKCRKWRSLKVAPFLFKKRDGAGLIPARRWYFPVVENVNWFIGSAHCSYGDVAIIQRLAK